MLIIDIDLNRPLFQFDSSKKAIWEVSHLIILG